MMFGTGRNDRNVVSMMNPANERRLAPLRQVESYWQALCGPDAVPLRSQIDPRGIEGALENAFLAERIAPSLAKMRVAGSHLSDLMGMEVAGMPLSALFTHPARAELGDAVTQLFADPAVVRINLRAEPGFGKPDLEGALILMPLRSDMGDVTRALGCLVTSGRIGRAPRRFEITSLTLRRACDIVGRPDKTPPSVRSLPQRNTAPRTQYLAEDSQPFRPAATAPGKHPYLRIVASNDD
ncbi:PAS domain-containing protein [Puniceibacterium sp. IMCC21224]|uniref:PAS domain-containing protein n=1 Tax=Puniceibacterium sp. IMCC21224 TaxID=1618204 RepID=UPI00065D4B32|nr:PAS domain-containing protein [Puniceibacterium sp. IMCC21224]KMK67470.1 hypothetical protein IMCC21224_112339 [Puniceibacterium sp. IMCC21224]